MSLFHLHFRASPLPATHSRSFWIPAQGVLHHLARLSRDPGVPTLGLLLLQTQHYPQPLPSPDLSKIPSISLPL